ncbi:MAG: DUF2281 domain-containing protein [Lachnospiraceae bacterium]|nr:DUF2281 domain-containing protein [Lachnospiraceae bacterium]
MTLQQRALNVIEHLSDEKLSQVIQFAEFLSSNSTSVMPTERKAVDEDNDKYIRKPGILKRKMVMSDDFDETPKCFKEYL